jgi:enamine deaminase RidA (YjgF/YER057c/UK114 family)
MPVNVRFGAERTRYRPQAGELELAVPLLAGAPTESLWPGRLQAVQEPDGALFLQGSEGPWRCVVLSVPLADAVTATARAAYTRLLEAFGPARGLRIWNFVPAINAERDGLENYRAFCLGRHEAFLAHYGPGAERYFCAASAVGTQEPRLTVIALGAELPVSQLENPFQCPAYAYPEQYGPRPPSFSRASVAAGPEPVLYISGTSAVLGSASVAPGELAGQLATTGENLHRMLAQAERALGAEAFASLGAPECRVYLRRSGDTPAVLAWLEQQPWHDPARSRVVRSDICRSELLVEIELSWPSALVSAHATSEAHIHGCDPL